MTDRTAVAAFVIVAGIAAAGLAQTTVVVTPASPHGWAPANVRQDAWVEINDVRPRNGNGSLEFGFVTVTPGQDKADYQLVWDPTDHPTWTLGSLDTLSFEYIRDATSTTAPHFAPVLRLYFYEDAGTPADTTDDTVGVLIWEEAYQAGFSGTIPTDQWISRDVVDSGRFWMYVISGPGGTGVVQNYGLTLADWEANTDPSTGQPPVGQPGDPTPPALGSDTWIVGVNTGVGSGWGDTFSGAVDTVTIGFGGEATRYDFEPAPAAEPGIPALNGTGMVLLTLTLLLTGVLVLRRSC